MGPWRGLAAALHSGDPAYDALPDYFQGRPQPALRGLLDAAVRRVRPATASRQARRMVALLVDGLRYRAQS